MIDIGKRAKPVHDVEFAPKGALGDGEVHVADASGAQDVASELRVVLEVAGRRLELTTSGYEGHPGGPATYVSREQAAGLAGQHAKMRRYGWRDRGRKWFSGAGILAWAPAVVALILGVAGVVFLTATAPADRAAVADRAKRVQAWVVDPPAGAPQSPTARLALAGQCLDGLAGRKIAVDVRIEGVECRTTDPSFFEDKDNAALIAAVGGLILAALGLLSALGKLTFGKAP